MPEETMSDQQEENSVQLGRRAFLKGGTLFLAGSALRPGRLWAAADEKPRLRIGLVTDLHHADKDSRGTRHYRETSAKLAEAARQFDKDKPGLVVELGDLIDSADSVEAEKGYLRQIAKQFAATPGQHHYVLGNHCVYSLTKPEFLDIVGQKASYYSFDASGYHFVILDACFRNDGQPYGRKNFQWTDSNIPPAEAEWLRADLAGTSLKTVVFVHQRLDVGPPMGIQNGPQIRKILEASGKVLAVMQGHHHQNDYKEIGGIHYCTLRAVIEGSGAENNAYAMLDLLPGDILRLAGFRKQKSYRWPSG
jgi:hypothetical protein